MKYLPFENITYRTKLDSEQILMKIDEVIEPEKTFRLTGVFGNSDHKSYEGSINGNSFKMTRIISYKNSFLPRIKGTVEKDFNGAKVKVKMRLHPFVIVFMVIWFGGIGIGCLAALTISSTSQNFEPMTLIPVGMLIFGYLLVTGGFKYESIKSKEYLAELFESTNEEEKRFASNR